MVNIQMDHMPIRRATLGSSVASLRPVGGDLLAAGLGSFMPTDARGGSVFWLRPTNGWSATPPVLAGLPRTTDANQADLNGDGLPDVVVGSTDHTLYALDGRDGHALWTFATKGAIVGPALLVDVDGDKVPDAIVGSDDGNLYAVSGKTGAKIGRAHV